MQQLLIATHNPAKIKELTRGIKQYAPTINIRSLQDLNITQEPVETGKTFIENAELKAKFYANLSNCPVIADDGGIMIDALHGEPGVISRRWPGFAANDKELIEFTLHKLRGIPFAKRTAQITTCLCLYDPFTKKLEVETESVEGSIAEKPSNQATNGFPYRALFIVKKFNKYYDELTQEEHEQINHRLIALKRLVKRL